ncbi:MAG: FoF1 ATP synthase subunit delta/epsilon [Vampirovibrionales bacterium]
MVTKNEFTLTLHTDQQTLNNVPIRSLQAVTTEGAFGLLKGHQPVLASLSSGVVTYIDTNDKTHTLGVSGGILASDGYTATLMAN